MEDRGVKFYYCVENLISSLGVNTNQILTSPNFIGIEKIQQALLANKI